MFLPLTLKIHWNKDWQFEGNYVFKTAEGKEQDGIPDKARHTPHSATFLRACIKSSAHVQLDCTGKTHHKSAICKGQVRLGSFKKKNKVKMGPG